MSSISPSRFYARGFAIVTAAALGFLVWQILSPFLTALLWGTLLAFMLGPWQEKLNVRTRRPLLSASILTAGATVLVLVPASLFVFVFLQQATQMTARFQAEALERKLPALQLVLEWSPLQKLLAVVGEYTSLSKTQIIEQAASVAETVLTKFAGIGGTVVLGTFSSVTSFLLTMFVLFFLLRDGPAMARVFWGLVPLREEQKNHLQTHLASVTRAVVMGTLVTALVQGTLIGIGFAIAGLASPVVFGAIGALASLVPIVGTTLVWVPGVITLFAQGETGWAIFLAVWSIVLVGGSDNVIRPLIISGKSNVSTLLVFLGALGGVGVFGFAGLFAGPLTLTLVVALIKFADEDRHHLTGDVPLITVPELPKLKADEPKVTEPEALAVETPKAPK